MSFLSSRPSGLELWAQSGVHMSKPTPRKRSDHCVVPLSGALGGLALGISLTAAISVWAVMFSLNNVGFTSMSLQVQASDRLSSVWR